MMNKLDLTESELFKNLIEVEFEDTFLDLHNDYNCNEIEYSLEQKRMNLTFLSLIDKVKKTIILSLVDVNIVKMNISIINTSQELTLDNFYRGRYEVDNKLYEQNSDGAFYYYLEFYENYSFEFFAKSVLIIVDESPS